MADENSILGEWSFATQKGGKFFLEDNGDKSIVFHADHKLPQYLELQNDGSWENKALRVRQDGKDLSVQQRTGDDWKPAVHASRVTSSFAGKLMRKLSRSMSSKFDHPSSPKTHSSSDKASSPEGTSLGNAVANGAASPAKTAGKKSLAEERVERAFPSAPSSALSLFKTSPQRLPASRINSFSPPPTDTRRSLQVQYTTSTGHITSQAAWTPVPAGAPSSLRRPLLQSSSSSRSPTRRSAPAMSSRVEDLALACVVAGAHGAIDAEGLALMRGLWACMRTDTSLSDVAKSLNKVYSEKRRCFIERQYWLIRFLARFLCWDMAVDAEDLRYVLSDWEPPSLSGVCAGLSFSRFCGCAQPSLDDLDAPQSRPRPTICGTLLGFFAMPSHRHGSACFRAFCEEFAHRVHQHQVAETCIEKLRTWSCRQMVTVVAFYVMTLVALFGPLAAQVYGFLILHRFVADAWTEGFLHWKLWLKFIILVACMYLVAFLSDYQAVMLPRLAMCGAKLRVGANLKPCPETSELHGRRVVVDDV
mmetsp:Transcript_107872/g.191083  ORF Transcript_107872/g.191083 Transcript_107872/m.191083 type:complete len:532 (-) Transcript_107872:13-1608(-)